MDSYVDSLQYMHERYEEVDGCRFYQELFPDNENCGQYFQDFSLPMQFIFIMIWRKGNYAGGLC